MDRQPLIAELVENMGFLGRHIFMSHAGKGLKKGAPTRAQNGIMLVVMHAGASSVKELAGKFCMSSSAVTQLVDGMVKEKLLKREEDGKDRRRIAVSLTEKGKKVVLKAKKERLAHFTTLLTPLNDTELKQLHNIQQKILTHLS